MLSIIILAYAITRRFTGTTNSIPATYCRRYAPFCLINPSDSSIIIVDTHQGLTFLWGYIRDGTAEIRNLTKCITSSELIICSWAYPEICGRCIRKIYRCRSRETGHRRRTTLPIFHCITTEYIISGILIRKCSAFFRRTTPPVRGINRDHHTRPHRVEHATGSKRSTTCRVKVTCLRAKGWLWIYRETFILTVVIGPILITRVGDGCSTDNLMIAGDICITVFSMFLDIVLIRTESTVIAPWLSLCRTDGFCGSNQSSLCISWILLVCFVLITAKLCCRIYNLPSTTLLTCLQLLITTPIPGKSTIDNISRICRTRTIPRIRIVSCLRIS